jgi:hypothetical protein
MNLDYLLFSELLEVTPFVRNHLQYHSYDAKPEDCSLWGNVRATLHKFVEKHCVKCGGYLRGSYHDIRKSEPVYDRVNNMVDSIYWWVDHNANLQYENDLSTNSFRQAKHVVESHSGMKVY